MAEIPRDQQGGIFIPYDKLLQQQSEKMDEILKEVRELARSKVDQSVFEAFRSAYEQKHQVVLDEASKSKTARERWVPVIEDQNERLDHLDRDKAERDAVKAQTRYYLAGGGLVGVLVLLNLVVNAWQIVSGGSP